MDEQSSIHPDVVERPAATAVEPEAAPDPRTEAPRVAHRTILHALAISLPHQNGYTVRSKYIIEQQVANGWQPTVATSPFYAGNEAAIHDSERNGVRYLRIPHPIDLEQPRTHADRWGARAHQLRKECRERARRLRKSWAQWKRRCGQRLQRLGALFRRQRKQPAVRRGASRIKRWARQLLQLLRRGRKRFVRRCRLLAHAFYGIPGARACGRLSSQGFRILRTGLVVTVTTCGQILGAVAKLLLRAVWFVLQSAGTIIVAIFEGIFALFEPLTPANLVDRFSEWLRNVEERQLLRRYRNELERICRDVKPDVIHAHSPYRNALPASQVAQALGIPFVYEVRGLWEESGVASGNFADGSSEYRRWRALETDAMRRADVLICICEQLREEAARRGVSREKIFITPNAADPGLLAAADPISRDDERAINDVAKHLRYPTVGYVGSLRKLEGVDELVRGAADLRQRGRDVSLLIVGDGPELPVLEELAAELGIADRAVFTGRVPHQLVRHYYDLIDVFVVSRPDQRVTRMVTPLKPLEAMALGKALVVSDLPALRELVPSNKTGLYYPPGDVGALADQCEQLLFDAARRRALGEAAREWVRTERTWEQTLQELGPAYDAALRDHSSVTDANGSRQ
ncbi:MAG: glycosyltransferase family 4 protein [Planctomycetota bacterium]